MKDSNFWYYLAAIVIIGHFLAGFVYLAIKLSSPKNKGKDEK